jgi:AraC-like DNA-binding protein
MWTALKGPAGIFLSVLLVVSAAVEWYSNASQRASSKSKEAADSIGSLFEVLKNGTEVTLTSVDQVDNLIEAYGNVVPRAVGRTKKQIKDLTDVLKEHRAELILNNALYEEQVEALGIDGMLTAALVAENEKLVKTYRELNEVKSKDRLEATERQILLNTQIDLQKQLAKAEGLLFINKVKNVGEPGETVADLERRVKLAQDAAKAGFSSTEAFATEYKIFQQRVSRIGNDISVTQEQFAKLLAEGTEEAFLKTEMAKADKRFGDEALERIKRMITNMEILNKQSERFGKLGSVLLGPEGLGVADAIGRAKAIKEGGVVTEDGVLRQDALDQIQNELSQVDNGFGGVLAGIGGGYDAIGLAFMNTTGGMTDEIAELGRSIEEQNRTTGTSFSAWWRLNAETVNQSAQLMGSAIGGIGTSFMTIARQGGEGSKSMFETGKKFAIAQALISTYTAITKALEMGPIIGPILAASIGVQGFAQVAAIRATKMGGSGTGGGVKGGGGGVSAPPNAFSNFTSLSELTSRGAGPSFGGQPQPIQTTQFRFVMRGDELIGVLDNTLSKGSTMVGKGTIGAKASLGLKYNGLLDNIYEGNLGI